MIQGGSYFMINIVLTFYVALWTYQAGKHTSLINTLMWTVLAAISFFTIQFLWFWIDAFLMLSSTRPIFGPPIAGFLVVAFIRTHFLMRVPLTLANLFGQLNVTTGLIKLKGHQTPNYPHKKHGNNISSH